MNNDTIYCVLMNLTIQDIAAMASYSLSEVQDNFIYNGDTFVLMAYKLIDKNHVHFVDYGLCSSYELEPEKDILMKYLSLSNFPPIPKTLSLQATQIVRGKFISSDGRFEIRISRLNEMFSIKEEVDIPNAVPFRKRAYAIA